MDDNSVGNSVPQSSPVFPGSQLASSRQRIRKSIQICNFEVCLAARQIPETEISIEESLYHQTMQHPSGSAFISQAVVISWI
ncbi:Protein of unknown function [Pyronema omphalodes CBS 100304]|uniref:Uncharacterized protein n=1 Tax=Pyronema omphalodes (strain CBS 100304) TaxID=1076935 RepID=U4KW72_PYROM|nr:Protein of unknown function [Pyronema omphalodes CBS 100304]